MEDLFGLLRDETFYLTSVQLYNWGTFDGKHEFKVSKEGTVITGKSGSGKSTILDANTALTAPPRSRTYNMASRNDGKKASDRNDISYILGAYGQSEDSDTISRTKFNREGPTFSVIAQTYEDNTGRTVTLIQLIYVNQPTTEQRNVKRIYAISKRKFDIAEFMAFEGDLRQLKKNVPETEDFQYFDGKYKQYQAAMCNELGIESTSALELLHKAQSAKNLGDIDSFLKDFMLDVPETYDTADKLANQYTEINAIYEHIKYLDLQLDSLVEIESSSKQVASLSGSITDSQGLIESSKAMVNQLLIDATSGNVQLLENEILELDSSIENLKEQNKILQTKSLQIKLECENLGGSAVSSLKQEIVNLDEKIEEQKNKLAEFNLLLTNIDIDIKVNSRASFQLAIDNVNKLKLEFDGSVQTVMEEHAKAHGEWKANSDRLEEVENELGTLSLSSSMVTGHPSRVRDQVCKDLNINVSDLPYVAEYIQIKQGSQNWTGAIERLMHSFGLTLLVPDEHFSIVTDYVNSHNLKGKLVYAHAETITTDLNFRHVDSSVLDKVEIKEGRFYDYVNLHLKRRFQEYKCFNDIESFKANKNLKGLTEKGLIRQREGQYVKDDRFDINHAGRWNLGWSNETKVSQLQEEQNSLEILVAKQKSLKDSQKNSILEVSRKQTACDALLGVSFDKVDVSTSLSNKKNLNDQLESLLEAKGISSLTKELDKTDKEITENDQKISELDQGLGMKKSEKTNAESQLKKYEERDKAVIEERFYNQLKGVFSDVEHEKKVDKIKQKSKEFIYGINAKIIDDRDKLQEWSSTLIGYMATFNSEFEDIKEQHGLISDINSVPSYIEYLNKIRSDDLIKFRAEFAQMLNDRSFECLSALLKQIATADQEITERLSDVNEALADVDFNSNSYLQIEYNKHNNKDAQECIKELRGVFDNIQDNSIETMESRFFTIKKFIQRYKSDVPADKAYVDNVLDISKKIKFYAQEVSSEDRKTVIEVYESDASRSGGQKEKLAATIMAAALSYHLSGDSRDVPTFAPIVLDEAFLRTDSEFTEEILKVFRRMGFQLIIGTPNKSLLIIEQFVGSAVLVDIHDKRYSYLRELFLYYDEDENFHQEAGSLLSHEEVEC